MKNIYFIGIGGIGMSAIARYYKFKGLNVAGYDRAWREAMSKGFIGRFFATNSILKKINTTYFNRVRAT